MNKRYQVFLPPPAGAHEASVSYRWHTVLSPDNSASDPSPHSQQAAVYPPATLDAASRRISLLYQNIIFKDSEEGEGDDERQKGIIRSDQDSQARHERTTYVTWAATTQADSSMRAKTEMSTFLRAEPSRMQSRFETQDTQEGTSYNCSDASSIARFPDFHFNMHALTTLSRLNGAKGTRRVNALLAVLEVDGPDTITIKKGADAGKQIYVLKMIVGDEDGVVCKVTAWRDVAETWGGVGQAVGIKRGDIVHLESSSKTCSPSGQSVHPFRTLFSSILLDVSAAWEPGCPVTMTASPHLKSKAEICYRSMPRTSFPEDGRLRPDLRLGSSDAAVRRVAAVVGWFERMAGLSTT